MRDRHTLLEKTRRDVKRLTDKENRPAGWIGMLFSAARWVCCS